MAPSTMFSYLRSHYRRPGSTPASPQPPRSPDPASPGFRDSSHPPSSPHQPRVQSVVSGAPPVLPPIPRVASKHEADQQSQTSSRAPALPPKDAPPASASSASRQASPANRQSYSLGIDFGSDVPFLPPVSRVTSVQDTDKPPSTPPGRTERPSEPTFSINYPDDSPVSASSASKAFRTYPHLPDLGFHEFRRASKLSTEPSQSSKSPSTNSRSHNFEAPFLQPGSHRTSSPSSSVSSFQKTHSASQLAADSSPVSSKSVQASTPQSSAPVPRLTKARHLLKPVSLLMKRRTSQGIDGGSDVPVAPQRMFEVPALEVPESYDPRIRGKRVHDFDEESRKPRRNHSTNDMLGLAKQSAETKGHGRRSSIPALSGNVSGALGLDKQHTPVFVENFDECGNDEKTEKNDAKAIQRESLANPDFLARMSRQLDFDAIDFSAPPPPQRLSGELPPTTPKTVQRVSLETPPASKSSPEATPTQRSTRVRTSKNTDSSSARLSSDQSTMRSSTSNDTGATTPPPEKSRPSLTLEPPFQPTTPLKHLSSNASHASRFSFQFNSDRSVEQEKALEEKHKAKYAAKAAAAQRTSVADSRFDEFEDEDFDYDAMDDGGFEEAIPGVNADDEEQHMGLGNARWSTLNPGSAPGATRASSQSHYTTRSPTTDNTDTVNSPVEPSASGPTDRQSPARTMTRSTVISDDMYYDDGMIGPQTVAGTADPENVDDSALDNYSESSGPFIRGQDEGESAPKTPTGERSDAAQQKERDFQNAVRQSELKHTSSLHDYHTALADAASKAAETGRFADRFGSMKTSSSSYSNEVDKDLQLDEDESVFGSARPFEDDADDEDPMVAAANAEVLASDDAEFYGQEFGFYRAGTAAQDGQMCNGGFFGQPNLLGAANPRNREPNLTPITERSEYSTRNSFIGSTPWGPTSAMSQSSINTPGLKDLAASIGEEDDNLTLGQLLRLRKAAFEGSGSSPRMSMQGSSGSNESSPVSAQNGSPLALKQSSNLSLYEQRRPSELELADVKEAPEGEEESDVFGSPISPNVTIGTAQAVPMGPTRRAERRGSAEVYAKEYQNAVQGSPSQSSVPVFAGLPGSRLSKLPAVPARNSPPPILATPAPRAPTSTPLMSPRLNDMPSSSPPVPLPPADMMQKFATRPPTDAYRKSWEPSARSSMSGPASAPPSTSVAYVREAGDDGREKWYLERRRKSSTGELVVLSREAVEGGRI